MYLNDNKYMYLRDIKCENMDYEKLVQDLDLKSENMFEVASVNEGRKRMRLHQLTWEEKIQRKKLRNRIAAQTSRDRKKAKMDHLEESVKELKQLNDLLFMEVQELKKRNEILADKNTELEKALAERSYTCSCMKKVRGEEERKEMVDRTHDVEEQICVEDGLTYVRPAESCEIPQQKGYWPTSAQGDKFLNDLERLATSLLEEVEQHEGKRNTESLFKEVSGIGQQKFPDNTTMVGEASEKLESCRSGINHSACTCNQQGSFWPTELSTQEKIWFITSEHSYSAPGNSNSSQPSTSTSQTNIPTVVISESDKISAIENELKKDIEPELLNWNDSDGNSLGVTTTFPNFSSPRSEVSSDLGYESPGSSYDNDLFKMNDFNDLNDLWEDPFSDFFSELI